MTTAIQDIFRVLATWQVWLSRICCLFSATSSRQSS